MCPDYRYEAFLVVVFFFFFFWGGGYPFHSSHYSRSPGRLQRGAIETSKFKVNAFPIQNLQSFHTRERIDKKEKIKESECVLRLVVAVAYSFRGNK